MPIGMSAMSMDLRKRVAKALGSASSLTVAERFAVSGSWVRKLWRQLRATGSVEPGGRGHRPRKVDAEGERVIRDWIQSKSDMTIPEVMARYLDERGVAVSEPAMRRTIRRMGLSRKKRRSLPPSAKAKRGLKRDSITSRDGSNG